MRVERQLRLAEHRGGQQREGPRRRRDTLPALADLHLHAGHRLGDVLGVAGERQAAGRVGGESQAGARPMHPDWARSIRDQCAAASVPFFMKQMGGPRTKMPPIPADLFIREMPNAR